MEGVLFSILVLTVAAGLLGLVRRWHQRSEHLLLYLSFLAHVGAVFVQVWIVEAVYGGGDIDGYYRSGVEIANALRYNFGAIFPEVVKVFFHQADFYLPFQVFGGPNATGSQTVVAALLFFLLSDSLYAAAFAVAMATFFGKLAIFHALSDGLPAEVRRRVLIGTTLVPSVVFWCSTLAKEAVVVACLGVVTLFIRSVVRGQLRLWQWALGVALVVPVAMIKPYLLVPFSIAVGIWFYWERSSRRGQAAAVKPLYLVFGAMLAVGGIIAVGRLSPQFAVDNLAKSTATIQSAGTRAEGGSNFQLRESVQDEEVSLGRQVVLIPFALPTALFRPFLFEVRNPMMFVNALETTVLLFLFLRLFWRGGWAWVRSNVMGNPTLLFCFVFTALLGTAVGLASTNMGSLSRYRMPFMPFFVSLVLVLDWLLMAKTVPAATPAVAAPPQAVSGR